VSAWLATYHPCGVGPVGDKQLDGKNDLLKLELGGVDPLLLHYELRRRFPDRLWTFEDDEGGFMVLAVSPTERSELELEEPHTELAARYVDSLIGRVSDSDP